jgi:murein DD-endopeptidase MepM/ murein hydrolase activator NlpD
MIQNLIHGINNAKMNASFKNPAYERNLGVGVHYGIDLVSSKWRTEVYGNGNGKVLASGNDSIFGNFVVLLYPKCYNHKTKKVSDLVIRQWHMAKVYVAAGQVVTKDTLVGHYGNTGKYTTGAHLHLEVSTDTVNYMWTPCLTGNSSRFTGRNPNAQGVATKATDKDMSNPLEWISIKTDAEDFQTWTTANDIYINAADKVVNQVTAKTMFIEEDVPAPTPPVVSTPVVIVPKDLTLSKMYELHMGLDARVTKLEK